MRTKATIAYVSAVGFKLNLPRICQTFDDYTHNIFQEFTNPNLVWYAAEFGNQAEIEFDLTPKQLQAPTIRGCIRSVGFTLEIVF